MYDKLRRYVIVTGTSPNNTHVGSILTGEVVLFLYIHPVGSRVKPV